MDKSLGGDRAAGQSLSDKPDHAALGRSQEVAEASGPGFEAG